MEQQCRDVSGCTPVLDIVSSCSQSVLSPPVVNQYSDIIFKKVLETDIGIKINGLPLNNLRYADDTVIMAERLEELQQLLSSVTDNSREMGLNINAKEIKFMVISRTKHANAQLELNGKLIEKVRKFKYIVSLITDNQILI